jgi:hypothetical protein
MLSVDAELTVTCGDESYRLHGAGSRLTLDVASFAALRRLRVHAGADVGSLLRSAEVFLGRADVNVDVRIRERTVAEIGPGAQGLFRYGPMRLHVGRLAWSWVQGLRSRH